MRYWIVLKAMMTRPWVWLMLVIGSFQGILLANAFLNPQLGTYSESFPAPTLPDETVDSLQQFTPLMLNDHLETVIGFNTTNIPDVALSTPGKATTQDALTFLKKMPQLEALILRPGTELTSQAISDLSALKQLRSLTIRAISLSNAGDNTNFPNCLSQLPNLRELYALGFNGAASRELPAMPELQILAADETTFRTDWISTLGTKCPKLRTLILRTTDSATPTPEQVRTLTNHPSLKSIYLNCFNPESVEQSLNTWRALLPGMKIQRGTYWKRRIQVAGFLSLVTMFVSMVFWVQAGLMMSLPQSMLMPKYQAPHLFWPIAVVAVLTTAYVVIAGFYGVAFMTAALIALAATTTVASGIPGQDITETRRQITRWMQKFDVVVVLGIIGLFFLLPAAAEGFLLGDHQAVVAVCLILSIASFGWKLVRTSSLSRIAAESGMNGIPGLELSNVNNFGQNLKPANIGLLGRLQLRWRERGVDHQIATMNRNDRPGMLKAALPGAGNQLLTMVIVLAMMVSMAYIGVRIAGVKLRIERSQLTPIMIPITSWAVIFLMSITSIQWILRRGVIACEFLRPFSRSQFWWSLRMAIFHDLKYLFGVFWLATLLGPCVIASQSPTILTILLSLAGAAGAFAWIHGWLLLCIIGKRLWLHSSIGCFTSTFAIVLGALSPGITVGREQNLIAAISTGVIVLLAGCLLQWSIHRKLDTWELA